MICFKNWMRFEDEDEDFAPEIEMVDEDGEQDRLFF
jgi:hypothetical protein